jgi:hypothetical protein
MPASAKYYQTRGRGAEVASDRVQVPYGRWVAVFIAREFKRLIREAGKAAGKLQAKNF